MKINHQDAEVFIDKHAINNNYYIYLHEVLVRGNYRVRLDMRNDNVSDEDVVNSMQQQYVSLAKSQFILAKEMSHPEEYYSSLLSFYLAGTSFFDESNHECPVISP